MTTTIDSLVLADVQILINLCPTAQNVAFSSTVPVYIKFINSSVGTAVAVKFSTDEQRQNKLGYFITDPSIFNIEKAAYDAMVSAGMSTEGFYLASA